MFVMWYDDSKRPLLDKVEAARAAYHQRFGVVSTLVLVHMESTDIDIPGVTVRRSQTVQKHTIMAGREGA